MLHLFKRHLIPIKAHFEQVLVLTYAYPRGLLAPLLPPGLELDGYEGHGFLAVAMVQTRRLRPAFLPGALGGGFFLTGYRIFTRLKPRNGQMLRGLKILRSDADRSWMVSCGNLLTRYGYRRAQVRKESENGMLRITVRTPGGEADLDVTAHVSHLPGPLPEESPFPDIKTARRFAGPLPHTFDYEPESHSMVIVRGRRSNWKPQPLRVEVHKNTFLQSSPFNEAEPLLANAFYLADVPYRWERGWREPLAKQPS
ncbi:MAG TPA: DUF2071 domain-containing protein [Acidobacteriota bacterium]|nr:DUF2071 domain-containing protein [Acidobacteriota bacterium]